MIDEELVVEQQFGGGWTELKLAVLGDYLREYRRIFERNRKARFFKTIYVDAFAGTGQRRARTNEYSENLPDSLPPGFLWSTYCLRVSPGERSRERLTADSIRAGRSR